jgi:alpha-mannosidase
MLASDGMTGPAIPTPDAQEIKTYRFDYSLFPHRGTWREADSFAPAYEFNYGLSGFQLPKEKRRARLPSRFSFVEIKPNSLILTALKRAESGDGVVLRFFETKGRRTRGEVILFKEPSSVKVVDLLEREGRRVRHQGRQIRLSVRPYEIVSLKVRF